MRENSVREREEAVQVREKEREKKGSEQTKLHEMIQMKRA